LTHHEVFVIERKKNNIGEDVYVYKKIMDARYAELRSVNE
jgi:hypothetical protein